MAKKKVIQRKKVRVAPDREEEIEEEVEVDEEDTSGLIGYPLAPDPLTTPATPQNPDDPKLRKSVAQQAEEMRLASAACPVCIEMAPRQCRAHKINLPI